MLTLLFHLELVSNSALMVGLVSVVTVTSCLTMPIPGAMQRPSVENLRPVWPQSTASGSIISSNKQSRLVVTLWPGLEATTSRVTGGGKTVPCSTTTDGKPRAPLTIISAYSLTLKNPEDGPIKSAMCTSHLCARKVQIASYHSSSDLYRHSALLYRPHVTVTLIKSHAQVIVVVIGVCNHCYCILSAFIFKVCILYNKINHFNSVLLPWKNAGFIERKLDQP